MPPTEFHLPATLPPSGNPEDLVTDVPVCRPWDIKTGRLWASPDRTMAWDGSMVDLSMIPRSDQAKMVDIDDELWQRIVALSGNPRLSSAIVALTGHPYSADLRRFCREERPSSVMPNASYEVYFTEPDFVSGFISRLFDRLMHLFDSTGAGQNAS